MKLYHGTNNKFDKFSKDFLGENTDGNASSNSLALGAHIGFWFCDNSESITGVYDNVLECEVEINNPMEVESLETLEWWIESQDKDADELREWMIEMGFDGIVIISDEEFECTTFVAFDESQIEIL